MGILEKVLKDIQTLPCSKKGLSTLQSFSILLEKA
jgi:hypothetical protein